MSKEKAKLRYFKIKKCGFYHYGDDKSLSGKTYVIFDDLIEWAKRNNKTIAETCTYGTPQENSSIMRTFCADIVKSEYGDIFLTTWNETPTTDNSVSAINSTKPIDQADVKDTKFDEGYVPGYGTYFWIIPSKNIYLTVRFNHILNGNKQFCHYLQSFLQFHSKFLKDQKINDFRIKTPDTENLEHFKQNELIYPFFESHLLSLGGQLDLLKTRFSEIRKLITKMKLDITIEKDLSVIQTFLSLLGIHKVNKISNRILNFKYESNYNPNENNIDDLLNLWQNKDESQISDIGFNLIGDSETYWLSKSIVKDEFDIEVIHRSTELIDITTLKNALTAKRDIVLSRIED
ncbi:MAG: hypothetical protein PHR06_08365 [Candidatus Cloacimonetes bacterium]|nr:hypothetical protein [Candidatus Cloacimonadota bacterium]